MSLTRGLEKVKLSENTVKKCRRLDTFLSLKVLFGIKIKSSEKNVTTTTDTFTFYWENFWTVWSIFIFYGGGRLPLPYFHRCICHWREIIIVRVLLRVRSIGESLYLLTFVIFTPFSAKEIKPKCRAFSKSVSFCLRALSIVNF